MKAAILLVVSSLSTIMLLGQIDFIEELWIFYLQVLLSVSFV